MHRKQRVRFKVFVGHPVRAGEHGKAAPSVFDVFNVDGHVDRHIPHGALWHAVGGRIVSVQMAVLGPGPLVVSRRKNQMRPRSPSVELTNPTISSIME